MIPSSNQKKVSIRHNDEHDSQEIEEYETEFNENDENDYEEYLVENGEVAFDDDDFDNWSWKSKNEKRDPGRT